MIFSDLSPQINSIMDQEEGKTRLYHIGCSLALVALATMGTLTVLRSEGQVAARTLAATPPSISSKNMSSTKVLSLAMELPPGAMVIDDQDSSFARYGNPDYWYEATSPPDLSGWYYNDHVYWTQNNVETVDNYAVWTVPLNGLVEVWTFIPANHATTQHAHYTIYYAGLSDTLEINQNDYYGEWLSLGSYEFASGTNDRVMLVDATGEAGLSTEIGFDAVAFVRHRLYLPLVLRNWSLPKQWSGIHLGNRNTGDWIAEMLAPFDPAQGGMWPRVVMAQSNQVFNISRSDSPTCTIDSISVKNWNLYNYLQRAAQKGGAWVIFRISPSPGNFEESILDSWANPDPAQRPEGRTLISENDTRPGGWLQSDNDWRFRSVSDIGDEIIAIQRFILWQAPPGYRWSAFGFEPANEPNIEWYTRDGLETIPPIHDALAWRAMDQYFSNLYNYVHEYAGLLPISVLTPPMAQSAYAETHNINSDSPGCEQFVISGYHEMSLTFDSADPKNDGYSWHNYWIADREEWAACPNGQHVSMWFPDTMESNIQNGVRPAIITEADLASPEQKMGNWLADKGDLPKTTALSVREFLYYEDTADVVAVWLLNDDTGNAEHEWHQAYTPTVGFRDWFNFWWYNNEMP